MSKKAVFCIAASVFQAVCIVDRLKDEGFLSTDTSLLFSDKTKSFDIGDFPSGAKANEDITAGAVSGAMLTGPVSWLPAVGSFVFPGVGLVVAAGPIWPALGREGAIFSEALIEMGIPAYEASRYEAKIKQGGILISIRVKAAGEAQHAERIFTEEGASEIASSSEVVASKRALTVEPVVSVPYPQPFNNHLVTVRPS